MDKEKPKISLKALRNLRNISQASLAESIGRNETTVVNWERGKTSMSIPDYFKIKELLDPKDQFFLEIKSS